MNLLHRTLFLRQQARQSRRQVCPACELPALFTFHGYDAAGRGGRVEEWQCGNCEAVMPLPELWPIVPQPRVSARAKQGQPAPVLSESQRQLDYVEAA